MNRKDRLVGLMALVECLNNLPPAFVKLMIYVAMQPGISVNELTDKMNIPQQTVSRYVGTLLGRYEDSQIHKPYLRQEISEVDPRKRSLLLTRVGEDFLDKLLAHTKHND